MPTLCVLVPAADRAQLAHVVANGNTPQKLAVRATILLMLADHARPSHIATRLALSRNHVHYWMRRYVAAGVGGVLRDAPRPGSPETDHGRARRHHCGRHPQDPAARCDALEHAHHGQGARDQ